MRFCRGRSLKRHTLSPKPRWVPGTSGPGSFLRQLSSSHLHKVTTANSTGKYRSGEWRALTFGLFCAIFSWPYSCGRSTFITAVMGGSSLWLHVEFIGDLMVKYSGSMHGARYHHFSLHRQAPRHKPLRWDEAQFEQGGEGGRLPWRMWGLGYH